MESDGIEPDGITHSAESQHERGLSPDEQRAERDEESRETPLTKFDLQEEETERETEEAVERIGKPLEPRDDADD
jgi:hypothetical protein